MTKEMITLFLNEEEYRYITNAKFIKKNILQLIVDACSKTNNGYCMTMDTITVDMVRDLFGNQLQIAGFNEEYEVNEEGAILEGLIDKFFVG